MHAQRRRRRIAGSSGDAWPSPVDSNRSACVAYAARIWTATWQQHSGEHPDGALALGPTMREYLNHHLPVPVASGRTGCGP